MAEGNGLLNRRTGIYPYRGFESRPLRYLKRLWASQADLRCPFLFLARTYDLIRTALDVSLNVPLYRSLVTLTVWQGKPS